MSAIKTIEKTYKILINEEVKEFTISFWKSRGFDLKAVHDNSYRGERHIKQLMRSIFGFPTTLTLSFNDEGVYIRLDIEWLTSDSFVKDRIIEQEPELYFFEAELFQLKRDFMTSEVVSEYSSKMNKFLNKLFILTASLLGFIFLACAVIIIPSDNFDVLEELGMLLFSLSIPLLIEFIIIYFIKKRDNNRLANSYLKIRKRKLKSNVDMWIKPKFLTRNK